jgi:hypothetical protein
LDRRVVGSRTSLDDMERRKIFLLPGLELRLKKLKVFSIKILPS